MAKGLRFRERALDEWFFGKPLPWRDDTLFLLSLHTGEPEGANGEFQNEVTYGGYRAVELPRNAATWERQANVMTNVREIRFPTCDEFEKLKFKVTHWALRPFSSGEVFRSDKFDAAIQIYARVRVVLDPGTVKMREI